MAPSFRSSGRFLQGFSWRFQDYLNAHPSYYAFSPDGAPDEASSFRVSARGAPCATSEQQDHRGMMTNTPSTSSCGVSVSQASAQQPPSVSAPPFTEFHTVIGRGFHLGRRWKDDTVPVPTGASDHSIGFRASYAR